MNRHRTAAARIGPGRCARRRRIHLMMGRRDGPRRSHPAGAVTCPSRTMAPPRQAPDLVLGDGAFRTPNFGAPVAARWQSPGQGSRDRRLPGPRPLDRSPRECQQAPARPRDRVPPSTAPRWMAPRPRFRARRDPARDGRRGSPGTACDVYPCCVPAIPSRCDPASSALPVPMAVTRPSWSTSAPAD